MHLTYITRVTVPSTAAQSRQVFAMAQAFHSVLGASDFTLVARRGANAGNLQAPFVWEAPRLRENQWVRYAQLLVQSFRRARRSTSELVFTRDIAVAYAVTLAGGRAVYEAHKEPKGFAARWFTHRLAKQQRFRLVGISKALGDYYHEQFGIPLQRILPAHDGVFAERYQALKSRTKAELRIQLGLPTDQLLIMHTGSIGTGRGTELFAQILGASADIHFVQVGGDANHIERMLEALSAEQRERVTVVPWQPSEKMPEYQMAADALLYVITRDSPLHWCCSPLKLFEYMATGNPIIGANIGSVAEVLNETNGFCFDPERPESLREAVLELRRNPAAAQERALTALDQVSREYSWTRRAQRIVEFAGS